MSTVRTQLRRGAYYDSIVLMRLQAALAALPGVEDAGVVMATPSNLALLASQALLPDEVESPAAEDLLIAVRAVDDEAAQRALGEVGGLLSRRRDDTSEDLEDFRPHSLESALQQLPEAAVVLVSVPGRYATGVARRALALGRHVFLYSDNVSLEDEVALKETGRRKGLLVLGPDCGTAQLAGTGLGFANRVRRGGIGLIGASGTGLQAVASHLHELGAGVSHMIGTGGRDLNAAVGATTTLQALALLGSDPDTRVLVVVSKPPEAAVVRRLLAAARATGKPTVFCLLGFAEPAGAPNGIAFAPSLEAAALRAEAWWREAPKTAEVAASRHGLFLRGLFSGGTLAQEVLLALRTFVGPLYSNLSLPGVEPLEDLGTSRGHTVLDLGEDAFTVGRLHPMMDSQLRLRRLRQEAADPQVDLLLLDVVLGDGAHPDPAAELAPAIKAAQAARPAGAQPLEVAVLLVGSPEDPQGLESQLERLQAAGAHVLRHTSQLVGFAAQCLAPLPPESDGLPPDPRVLEAPLAAINVGLELFYDSLRAQGARAVQLDWRPPAGGDERLAVILDRIRRSP